MVPTSRPSRRCRLKQIREEAGFSQLALAKAAGISQPMLWRFEQEDPEKRNEPKGLTSAHAIAAVLGVDVFDIWPDLAPQPTPHRGRQNGSTPGKPGPTKAAKSREKRKA